MERCDSVSQMIWLLTDGANSLRETSSEFRCLDRFWLENDTPVVGMYYADIVLPTLNENCDEGTTLDGRLLNRSTMQVLNEARSVFLTVGLNTRALNTSASSSTSSPSPSSSGVLISRSQPSQLPVPWSPGPLVPFSQRSQPSQLPVPWSPGPLVH